ncbi:hypothetical protein HMPREF9072_00983, partial [Capnocytophaga sp. oral taxon 324 str. F0483]
PSKNLFYHYPFSHFLIFSSALLALLALLALFFLSKNKGL